MNNKKSKKKKSGGSPLPIIIIILVIGGVAGSNFVGPAKGWMTGSKSTTETADSSTAETSGESKITDTPKETAGETESNGEAGKSSDKTGEADTKESTENSKALTEFEKKHKEFFDEYMTTKAKLPEIGRRYPVVTINNDIRDGVLSKVDEYSIFLTAVKPYNAKTSIHYSRLRPDMAKYFFPEKAANTYANKMLEKYLSERNVIDIIEEEMTPKEGTATASTAKKTYSSSFKDYDTAVADSSPRLAHAAMEVNNYLKNQVRITKKRDNFTFADVDKCHAKQQGSSAVFYMYVTPQFVGQNDEYKFQVVDGIRRFWALRCMSNGVAGDSKAYLCIVNGSQVVGGSTIGKADDIFVK